MRRSNLEHNWERAAGFLQDMGARLAPIGSSLSSRGTVAVTAAATGVNSLAGAVRRMSSPGGARAVARSLEKTADYLRYRPADRMARDAWRAVNRKPVWITAGSALGGWLVYRWLTRSR